MLRLELPGSRAKKTKEEVCRCCQAGDEADETEADADGVQMKVSNSLCRPLKVACDEEKDEDLSVCK